MNRSASLSITHPQKLSSRLGSVSDALIRSCEEAERIQQTLFQADACSSAGLLVAQLRLLFARLQQGIAVSRSDLLSVLTAASRMPRPGE